MRIIFSIERLSGSVDIASIEGQLRTAAVPSGTLLVAGLTYNDFTRAFSSQVFAASRAAHVAEVVVFKDPAVAPYLCEFPAAQRKFRRPP